MSEQQTQQNTEPARSFEMIVGDYLVTPYGVEDFWIENGAGEGMQVFRANFERLIGDYFKSEF